NLRMRDLVFRQLSTQCSISNSIIYLNDFSATLNDTDFVNATGTLNLRRPHHYSGKVSANIANLSTLQPLLRASGNQNELAGAVRLAIDKIQLNQLAPPRREAGRSGSVGERALPQQYANYAYGYISIPFIWRNLGTKAAVIPSSGKVSATFQSENLDLKRAFDD